MTGLVNPSGRPVQSAAEADRLVLDANEQRWLRNRMADTLGRSKYVPHQGKRERARRLKQMSQETA